MVDSGYLILEKSFTGEKADFAEKAEMSSDFDGKWQKYCHRGHREHRGVA